MKLVDVNVLIYAVNIADPKHERSRGWLDAAIGSGQTVALPWLSLLGFVRLVTKPGVLTKPLDVDGAFQRVAHWLERDNVVTPEPTSRHLTVLHGLLSETGTGGNLASDAHLAALAVEHGGTVISFDHDFGRFPGVRWEEPR